MARRADTSGGPPWGRRPPDSTLRIGDTERNEVADALSQHFSDGRIDQMELKERLDKAMSAKTGVDLEGILSDLPPLPGQQPAQMSAAPVPHRHGSGLWLVVGVVLLATMAAPWHFGAWMWFPRVPWLFFGIVAVVLWRRSRRRHRWRTDSVS
ncbi:MAG: DUF1707 SHOCT-like domain-containing protein [Acidimicrobiales bacterium]